MLSYPPIRTVGAPGPTILPVGLGMGATQDACAVILLSRAAGKPPISTVAEPMVMIPGPAGTQPGNKQGTVISVLREAGIDEIRTVG